MFLFCKSIYVLELYVLLLNTLYIEIKHVLKNFLSDKLNITKNVLFFLSQAPTHHSFSFNLWFLRDEA